jgi:hypothetical protein
VQIVFQVTQHNRDEKLLRSFIDYFGCGKYKQRRGSLYGDFTVVNISDIIEKIIPFFNNYPLQGVKRK